MVRHVVHTWNEAPLLRPALALMAGIILQRYVGLPALIGWCLLLFSVCGLLLFNLRVGFLQFSYGWLNGILIQLAFVAAGVLLLSCRSSRPLLSISSNRKDPDTWCVMRMQEPLSERERSYRSKAVIEALIVGSKLYRCDAELLVYFQKSSKSAALPENARMLTRKRPVAITNNGRSAFDFQGYMALQGIYYQARFQDGDYCLLPPEKLPLLKRLLSTARQKVIGGIRQFVPGTREAGLAEALLIGFRDDLDKDLVQSYANTGLVHIIAISGMHLGLIYWLLAIVTRALGGRVFGWLRAFIIITGLWLFALLSGAGPSIARSAVMFSSLLIGQSIGRRYASYNVLAASCLLLLCFEPQWLWDAGFQLSYLALLSIFIFHKPISRTLEFNHPLVDATWQLCSVTLAAQLLTLPIGIYLFHQFPLYFLPANLLAVPMSTLVILAELVLCALTAFSPAAIWAGRLIGWLLRVLNSYIGYLERLPLASWKPLIISLPQTLFLYAVIAGIGLWIFQKRIIFLYAALIATFGFFLLRDIRIMQGGAGA